MRKRQGRGHAVRSDKKQSSISQIPSLAHKRNNKLHNTDVQHLILIKLKCMSVMAFILLSLKNNFTISQTDATEVAATQSLSMPLYLHTHTHAHTHTTAWGGGAISKTGCSTKTTNLLIE